jgi:hypothetical protein
MLRSSEASLRTKTAEIVGFLRSEDLAQNDVFRAKFVKDIFAFLNHAQIFNCLPGGIRHEGASIRREHIRVEQG